jgi:hypothetical protein
MPSGSMFQYRIENRQQLAHAGGQGHLGGFARGVEPRRRPLWGYGEEYGVEQNGKGVFADYSGSFPALRGNG